MGLFKKDKDGLKQKYTMGKQLGSGNFATVFKATKKEDQQIVAVKVIDKSKVEDMGDIEREVEIMNTMDHPNIIKLFEIFDEKKKMNLVMELVEGGELFDAIVDKGQFNTKEAAGCMAQLCSALDYCHKLKIVHRDLKPENLLVAEKKYTADSHIKVADFGLARVVSDKDMMKTACGTPGYVAPEVLKNKGYDSGAVDLWSAGVILYILLCGFPPFYEEEMPALFDQIMKARYDFPSPWWDDIPEDAKNMVKKLLIVDPTKRMTAAQVLADPWTANAPDTVINLGNLKKYNMMRKFKKAAEGAGAQKRVLKALAGV